MFVTEADILLYKYTFQVWRWLVVITTNSTTTSTDLQDWLPAYPLFTSGQIQYVLVVLVVEWKKHTLLVPVATDLNFKK